MLIIIAYAKHAWSGSISNRFISLNSWSPCESSATKLFGRFQRAVSHLHRKTTRPGNRIVRRRNNDRRTVSRPGRANWRRMTVAIESRAEKKDSVLINACTRCAPISQNPLLHHRWLLLRNIQFSHFVIIVVSARSTHDFLMRVHFTDLNQLT